MSSSLVGTRRGPGYCGILSDYQSWLLQAPGAWLCASPAPILHGNSRPCDDILDDVENGVFVNKTNKFLVTRDIYKRIHEALSPDPDPIGSFVSTLRCLKAVGIAKFPRKALELLEHGAPGRSCLSGDAGALRRRRKRISGRVHFDPATQQPRTGGLRCPKDPAARRLPADKDDPFQFPDKWLRRRARKVRADQQIAINEAADLADAVWHLWIDFDENQREGPRVSDQEAETPSDAASADRSPSAGHARTGGRPAQMGSMRFIVDTGCGYNLIGLHYLRSAGALGKLNAMKTPITLNTAGGPSKALGTVRVACDQLPGGSFESVVMKETPGVLSVGKFCTDHGCSFYWRAGKTPYLLLPNGMRLDLTVEGKIPYLYLGKHGGPSLVDDAAPAPPARFERWACVAPNAMAYLDDPAVLGGPPLQAVRYRTTLELHSLKVIAEDEFENGKLMDSSDSAPGGPSPAIKMLHGQDTLTYFYYEPHGEAMKGKAVMPTGHAACTVPPPPTGGHATGGLATPAVPGPENNGGEGDIASGSVEVMDDDGPSDSEELVPPAEESKIAKLKREARSREHLRAHLPKNPFCPHCTWAKAVRIQQRKKQNKAYKMLRPYSEPTKFGELCTMDHWFTQNDLSKGLYGETACVTMRDRFTGFLAAEGVHDKSAERIVEFLVKLPGPTERMRYMYSDAAPEITRACKTMRIAHDATEPGNKKQNSVAERANAIVQDGGRTLLMAAGLPAQFWVYAVPYFCLCHNAQARNGEQSPWERRFGQPFQNPLLPFGSVVRYLPPANTRLPMPKMGPRTRVGIYLGYVSHVGGRYGPDHYCMPLDQLEGLNYRTGMKQNGKRPVIDKTQQVWTNIHKEIIGPVGESGVVDEYQESHQTYFPLRVAYDKYAINVHHIDLGDMLTGGHAARSVTGETGGRDIETEPEAKVPGGPSTPSSSSGKGAEMRKLKAESAHPRIEDDGEQAIGNVSTDDDPTDDEGPSGPPPPPPAARILRPGFPLLPGARLEIQEDTRTTSRFVDLPSKGKVKKEQILARTVQNVDTCEYYEVNRVVLGLTKEELTMPLPLKGRRKTCQLRTVFYYDPEYVKPNSIPVWDAEFGHATYTRTNKDSTNPGVHPARWWHWNQFLRQLAIEEYKTEKKGFYGMEDPGPRTELLEELGITMPRPPIRYVMGDATPTRDAPAPSGGHASTGADAAPAAELVGDYLEFPHAPLFPDTSKYEETDTTDPGGSDDPSVDDSSSDGEDVGTEEIVADAAAASRRMVPRMPMAERTANDPPHREKIYTGTPDFNAFMDSRTVFDQDCAWTLPRSWTGHLSGDACVARPMTKKEAENNERAQNALRDEWARLRKINTWVEKDVIEFRKLQEIMGADSTQYHIGRLFSILVEKNAELPGDHPDKKYKGRVVFDGSSVVDQDKNVALFQELSSCPATMQACKAADSYGCFPNHVIQQADAIQAYTQAELGGLPTWVRLPKEAWPDSWKEAGMIDPVCPLRLALYGHPDSGGYWEQRCEAHVLEQGFVPCSPWRSCYFHPELDVFLIVYVDDFKMSGPAGDAMTKAWDLIRARPLWHLRVYKREILNKSDDFWDATTVCRNNG